MGALSLVVDGAVRSKKNSQRILRNRKSGKPFIAQSKQHDSWAAKAIWQIKIQRRGITLERPVNMAAVIYVDRHGADLLNLLAAVSDALEAGGAVANDRLIVGLNGSRMEKDAARPRAEITLTEVA
ncbi:MAG TPA: hypothetical protein VIA18_28270 [Polyangia bacterium]|nr:hypothetical protein [Polyangia bacterium]